ncbi:hypothetical protein Pelo_18423 [Pelomyxa schiedti]|nr:hypothetical protein Pelo_18423 [Pelomyxa schiedti]
MVPEGLEPYYRDAKSPLHNKANKFTENDDAGHITPGCGCNYPYYNYHKQWTHNLIPHPRLCAGPAACLCRGGPPAMRRVQPRPLLCVSAVPAPPVMGLLPVTCPSSEVSVDVPRRTEVAHTLANNHVDWRRGGVGLDTRQMITFRVLRSLVGVVGPVCVGPAWSPAQIPEMRRVYSLPQCVVVGNTFHVLETSMIRLTSYKMLNEYTLKRPPNPSTTTTTTTTTNGVSTANKYNKSEGLWVLRGDAPVLSSGHVNNKWWVCCDTTYTDSAGAYISRISDCISQRNGKSGSSSASPPVVCTLLYPRLLGFFFSKSNHDEAAMVTANCTSHQVGLFCITVIDVESTFQTRAAKQLSQTKWMIYDDDVAIKSGMIFHNQTTGSRTFVVVTQRCFEPRELFVVEEGTGSHRRFEFLFQAVSQLNDTVFCVSLSSEYQLWEARVNRKQPLRRVSICSHDVVTAECGLLFHRTEHNSVINVIHAATGSFIFSFTVSPQATTHPSGFLL